MKVQNINTPKINNPKSDQQKVDKSDVRFTGWEQGLTLGLRFLDTNQAVGANLVDLGSMVIPRTSVDFINRGPAAGTETLRREATGTTNHSLVGVYGTLGGLAVASASGLNSNYKINAYKIFADNNTLNIISKSWNDALQSGDSDYISKHVDTIINKIRVFNTNDDKVTGLVEIPDADKKLVKEALTDAIKKADAKEPIPDKLAKYLYNVITAATGGEKNVVLLGEDGKNASNTLKTLINNIYNLTNAFNTEDSLKAFKDSVHLDGNVLINSLKKMNGIRSKIGLGIATAIGMSTQPINMYLTKKKTGTDGFVGVEGREKDKTKSFKVMKTITALAFGAGVLSTITVNPKKFASKLQFQGMLPTIDQLKFVYGMTITSRLLAARDKDELRESAVKDSLGFLNLLVLGALVSKYSAKIFDSNLINKLDDTGKTFWGKVKNEFASSLKTRDEVLFSALKKDGIDVVRDGEALPVKELFKLAKEIKDPAARDRVKEQLRALNFSQAIGYIYSAVVLGFAIPKLNIYMTDKSEAKRKAKLAEQNNLKALPSDSAYQNVLKPENMSSFLGKVS